VPIGTSKGRAVNIALSPLPNDTHAWDAHAAMLRQFDLATPELLASRELQTRVDTKFVLPARLLPTLLASMSRDFALLTADGAPFDFYSSVYFDTPRFDLFTAHALGRRPRHKVRIRHYSRRDLCFLEVKTKDKYNVTSKSRTRRDARRFELSDPDRAAIAKRIGPLASDLVPVAQIDFPRVTLLGLEHEERLTLDLGVNFHVGDREALHDQAVIAEIKQARFWPRSPGFQAFRDIGIRPFSISKFCVALSELSDVARTNSFRPAVRALHRLDHA
jgi:hypothetical protein